MVFENNQAVGPSGFFERFNLSLLNSVFIFGQIGLDFLDSMILKLFKLPWSGFCCFILEIIIILGPNNEIMDFVRFW